MRANQLQSKFTNFKESYLVQNIYPEQIESYIASCDFEKVKMNLKIRFDSDEDMEKALSDFSTEKDFEEETSNSEDTNRAFLSFLLNYESRRYSERERKNVVVNNPKLLIPCILHLTSRTGEKLWRLLIDECLLKMHHLSESEKKNRVQNIETLVSTKVLNSGDLAASDIIIKVENQKLKSFSIASNRLRRTINKMEEIINMIYIDETDKLENMGYPSYAKIKDLFTNYNKMMEIFKIPGEQTLETEQIYAFQDSCDIFAAIFLEIFEPKHITNYFHMLFAGHITEMMIEHGNLNQYTQQGWEGLNGVYKQALYKLSNRGGATGCGGEKGKVK